MLHTQNFMKVYTNVNGKENWKMVSAKGDNKKGIDLKIKEKGKPTINKKLDFKELFSLMDQREDGLNMRLNNLLRTQNHSPQIVFMKPENYIEKRIAQKAKKTKSKRRRRRRKTNKSKKYKAKKDKTLKKRRKNKRKEEMSIFKDIF